MVIPSDNWLKISIEKDMQYCYYSRTFFHGKNDLIWIAQRNQQYITSCSNLLTVDAVEAKDETDEALQCYLSRRGAVAQSHQIQHIIADPLSWQTLFKSLSVVDINTTNNLISLFMNLQIVFDSKHCHGFPTIQEYNRPNVDIMSSTCIFHTITNQHVCLGTKQNKIFKTKIC